MLKRVLIAVFVLGLVIGLNGTALSDVAKGPSALNSVEKVNANHPRLNDLSKAGPAQPAAKKPAGALEGNALPAGLQLPALKSTSFCDVQDYTSGTLGYGWSLPDAYGDDLFNMRFTSEANQYCTLQAGHFVMFGGTFGSGRHAMTGDPDMMVYLWDDDGFGFPGNKLDSILIPWATIQSEFTLQGNVFLLSADFSAANWVFTDGEEYHIGFSTVQNSPDDTLTVLSDLADGPFVGEERASEYWGVWGTMLNDWGIDVSFHIYAERCCAEIPYSDCYTQSYIQNVAYIWRAPHYVYGDAEYAMKFDVAGPETLMSVDVAIYNNATYDPSGNQNIFIRVYDDDGGLPGTLLYTQVLAPGTYGFYPALQNVPFNEVMTGAFHVSFGTDGVAGSTYETCLSSDGTDGTGRSSSYWDTSGAGDYGWVDFLSGWGLDVNFYIEANMCKDEYADCSIQACYVSMNYYWQLPDRYGDFGQAQKFSGVGEECRIDKVNIQWYWNRAQYTWPRYTYNTDLNIYADAGGLPGALLGTYTITPANYGIATPTPAASTFYYATYDLNPLNITVTGSYWVGVESQAPDTLSGICTMSDAGGGACEAAYAEYWGDWGTMTADWGLPSTVAMLIESEHCCIPYSERTCDPAPFTNWPTLGGSYARSNASSVQMSDSWCDLTLNWHYEHPTSAVSFTGPVVYGDKVACSFTGHYKVFDLLTGAELYTYTPNRSFPAGDIRCAPTVTMITGYADPVMFVSGGTNDEVHAVNFNTGAQIWARAAATVGPAQLYGDTRYCPFIVLNVGGVDNVYWGTDGGRVVGADALTGTLLAGFPVNITLSPWASGASDGTSLFFSTFGTGVEGDIYSINPATGAINWQLSGTDDLQGPTVWGAVYIGDEGFRGGVSYDAQRGWLYANSGTSGGDHPVDGIFYRINASTGALAGPALLANRVLYASPTVDASRVYMASFTRWATSPAGGDIYAVNKITGTIDWAALGSPESFPYYCSAVLSCEPLGVSDQIYAFGYNSWLSVFNAETGDELWNRRWNTAGAYTSRGQGGALAYDGTGAPHLVFGDLYGNLYDLTKQADRPRLEFQTYSVGPAVEFGPLASLLVTVPDVLANTGCADLVFTGVNVDELDFGPYVPAFVATTDPSLMNRVDKIADRLVSDEMMMKLGQPNGYDVEDNYGRDINIERRTNYAAAGFPTWLNSVVQPAVGDIILPGDTMDLILDVIQANINRGPQSFYIQLETNDPDFFLNDLTLAPQMQVTVIGGCLIDTTAMDFGMGGANQRLVTNSSRLGTGDWGDGAFGHNGILIDGDGASYYQGSLAFMAGKYRAATHTQDWTSGGGEADAMISMQPDPNWCDNTCKAAISLNVTLGYATSDGGLNYDPILGNMVCASYLDSVQNFDLGGGWDWTNWGAPFDDTLTMGLYVNSKVLGVLDYAPLANVTLDVLEITERNGNAVDNWYLSHFFDCDNGSDTMQINRTYSVGWTLNAAGTQALGSIKIPFGCGYTPLKNVWGTYGTSGAHGFFDWNQYWDTAYWYCQTGTGAFTEAGGMSGGDGEVHITIDQHNFLPNETYKVGVGTFLLTGLTGALNPNNADIKGLASTVNKWAGFGRGDVNNDGVINLPDIIYLAKTVNVPGAPGAVPFQHLSDVNADDAIDILDVNYLIAYYFDCGPCPAGEFIF